MSLFGKNQDKNGFLSGSSSRNTSKYVSIAAKDGGKTIYNKHDRFDWNTVYVKQNNLQKKRVQTDGPNSSRLNETASLIKLEEEAALQTGYNPYNSGLSAMKQSRKPPELHDLTRHHAQLRKSDK